MPHNTNNPTGSEIPGPIEGAASNSGVGQVALKLKF
jgi:hypothetical protein